MLKDCVEAARARLGQGVRARMRRLLASSLCLGFTASLVLGGSSLAAAADNTPVWTVTLIKHYNKAVENYNRGDWRGAKDEFRTVIGLEPNIADFYVGLLNTCMHSEEWDQVALAAEKLGQLDPVLKNQVAFDYGMALYKLNRFDEAVPVLKRALQVADQPIPPPYHPTPKDEQLIDLTNPGHSTVTAPPIAVTAPVDQLPPPKPREKVNPEQYLTYENAIKSEFICLAEYKGYDKGDIYFNNPPISHWQRTKILKGPPLNANMPVRYEFHDMVNKDMPVGWTFDESKMMPKKDSLWILFIEFAYPMQGAYQTYQGSYGRQEATPANLNDLYARLDAHNMREQKAE